jgi:class 3 adenylate cyclase/CHASE2 domain-containing sensor protein
MIRLRRKLLIDTLVFGVALTLLVILADQLGLLRALDHWFYDERALYCQQFAPRPTTQLVHIDIDDRAIDVIGRYPWTRTKLALIFDELARAKPKAVATDIIYSEPEEASYQPQLDGTVKKVDADAEYAATIERVQGAIVPAALFSGKSITSPLASAMLNELSAEVELDEAALVERLTKRGFAAKDLPTQINALFFPVRREAVFQRVYALLKQAPATTLPTSFPTSQSSLPAQPELLRITRDLLHLPTADINFASPMTRVVREQYTRASALREMDRLSARQPGNGTPVITSSGSYLAPLTAFTRSAHGTGFVDFFSNGVVRDVPLLASHDGRLFPQLGLSLALAMMDQNVSAIRYTPTSVTIPRPGALPPLVVPVRTGYSTATKGGIPLLMDIPWFGSRDWELMYDAPRFEDKKQHMTIVKIWDICEAKRQLRLDNVNCDDAILNILGEDEQGAKVQFRLKLDPPKAVKYLAHRPDLEDAHARVEMAAFCLKELESVGWLESYSQLALKGPLKPEESAQWEQLKDAKRALESTVGEAQNLQKQIEQQRRDLAQDLGGKAILIGWTATGAAADFVPTPLHAKCPGVVVHGAVFNAIMTGHFWRQTPKWVVGIFTLLLGLATAGAAVSFSATRGLLCALGLLIAYLLINGLLLFGYFNLLTGIAAPVLTIAFVWAMCTLYRIIVETREREHMKARFQTYVDPMLVDYLLEHPEKASLEGQVKEMTVVFTDLANFTALAERIGERSVTLLNEYMARMVPIIRGHRGYLNKFLGDGIMCFYGAPADSHTHAADAVRTALGMQSAMAPFNEKFTGGDLPALAVRVGISTGNMVVGDAGAPDASDFTVLGDAVNLGSRLEGANKIFGTHVMISAETAANVAKEFLLRPLGRLQVVGKTQGVDVFEPLAPIERATDHQKRTGELTKALVEAFKSRQFQVCIDATHALDQHAGGATKLTRVYRELSERYLQESPPLEWHGTISLTDK